MASQTNDKVLISENEARAGVTGHHVRYVLLFGLIGSVVAFVALGLYFGHRKLTEAISDLPTRIDSASLLAYGTPIAIGAVVAVLLLGLWDLLAGRSSDASQRFMRVRVVLQFVAIGVAMTMLYISAMR
jgi:hypothetical protein